MSILKQASLVSDVDPDGELVKLAIGNIVDQLKSEIESETWQIVSLLGEMHGIDEEDPRIQDADQKVAAMLIQRLSAYLTQATTPEQLSRRDTDSYFDQKKRAAAQSATTRQNRREVDL